MKVYGYNLNKLTAKSYLSIGIAILTSLLFYIILSVAIGFSGKFIFKLVFAVGIMATLLELGVQVVPKTLPFYVISAAIAAGFGNLLYYFATLAIS